MNNDQDLFFDIWQKVIRNIGEHLNESVIEHWFLPIKKVQQKNNKFCIYVLSTMHKDWMKAHYSQLIKDALYQETGQYFELSFVLPETNNNQDFLTEETLDNVVGGSNYSISANANSLNYNPPTQMTQATAPRSFQQPEPLPSTVDYAQNDGINPRYTFESFVVGSSNRFAHAACLAVAERPAQSYNPLFLYGGSGLGKTHLMHAIKHRITELNQSANVVYISTEAFTTDFINSVRLGQGRASQFKNRYRTADIFLVDDIQFLTGKEGTQEEFFHTFNALHEQGKQIVISSDRHPKDIATLEERLRSRFEGGLITDIQAPDLETRIAILQYKADWEGFRVPDDVLYYIANNVLSNIRELEGALNRVIAYSRYTCSDGAITLSLAKEALSELLPPQQKRKLSVEWIKELVSDFYELKIEEMDSKKRDRNIAWPRQIAMYLCRELLGLSLPKIGKNFGGRDHTTVLHACDKINKLLEKDKDLEQQLEHLTKELKG